MRGPRTRLPRGIGVALGALAVASTIGYAVSIAQRLPAGPEPIAWDREACAFCRMHVGDPRFAAQLQTRDGTVRDYDDPGCLLSDPEAVSSRVHAIWFRDSRSDRWLSPAQAGFVAADPTPMGFGLAAVPNDTPGAIDLDAARERVRQWKGRSR